MADDIDKLQQEQQDLQKQLDAKKQQTADAIKAKEAEQAERQQQLDADKAATAKQKDQAA